MMKDYCGLMLMAKGIRYPLMRGMNFQNDQSNRDKRQKEYCLADVHPHKAMKA
jgi:hypothetical protein